MSHEPSSQSGASTFCVHAWQHTTNGRLSGIRPGGKRRWGGVVFPPLTDIGKFAMSLVDGATLVVGTPTVLAGSHPLAAYATFLANALRSKVKFLSIIGSYGWGGKTVEILAGMIPNLKVEVLTPVLSKGVPLENDFKALNKLADAIAIKHREHNLT